MAGPRRRGRGRSRQRRARGPVVGQPESYGYLSLPAPAASCSPGTNAEAPGRSTRPRPVGTGGTDDDRARASVGRGTPGGNGGQGHPRGHGEPVLVLGRAVERGGRLWVRVRLPVLPNDTTGWVDRSALGAYQLVRDQYRRRARRAPGDALLEWQGRLPRPGRRGLARRADAPRTLLRPEQVAGVRERVLRADRVRHERTLDRADRLAGRRVHRHPRDERAESPPRPGLARLHSHAQRRHHAARPADAGRDPAHGHMRAAIALLLVLSSPRVPAWRRGRTTRPIRASSGRSTRSLRTLCRCRTAADARGRSDTRGAIDARRARPPSRDPGTARRTGSAGSPHRRPRRRGVRARHPDLLRHPLPHRFAAVRRVRNRERSTRCVQALPTPQRRRRGDAARATPARGPIRDRPPGRRHGDVLHRLSIHRRGTRGVRRAGGGRGAPRSPARPSRPCHRSPFGPRSTRPEGTPISARGSRTSSVSPRRAPSRCSQTRSPRPTGSARRPWPR